MREEEVKKEDKGKDRRNQQWVLGILPQPQDGPLAHSASAFITPSLSIIQEESETANDWQGFPTSSRQDWGALSSPWSLPDWDQGPHLLQPLQWSSSVEARWNGRLQVPVWPQAGNRALGEPLDTLTSEPHPRCTGSESSEGRSSSLGTLIRPIPECAVWKCLQCSCKSTILFAPSFLTTYIAAFWPHSQRNNPPNNFFFFFAF